MPETIELREFLRSNGGRDGDTLHHESAPDEDLKDENFNVYSQENPLRDGFTKCDQKDMYRMGKKQELKVRRIA